MRKEISGSFTLTGTLGEIAEWVKRLQSPPRQWQVFGVVINGKGQLMSETSTTYTLTNAADPSKATRFIGFIDLVDGTTLPSIAVSDPTKLTSVMGTFVAGNPAATPPTNSGVPFALYPTDTADEASDSVTATITLGDNTPIVLDFVISGEPPESDALDPSQSLVGPWTNAPAVPATPT